jgi:16S rRNA (uracil1498-N3)-methyltransferase
VELGVHEITPLFTERSMVQLKGERLHNRMAHWRGVIRHACEQSGRSRLPILHDPQSLPGWVQGFQGNGVMLDHRAEMSLVQIPAPQEAITLLVGPEGGLSPRERESAARAGMRGVRMGPRVLRTETAPLAALAVIQALWGDFR